MFTYNDFDASRRFLMGEWHCIKLDNDDLSDIVKRGNGGKLVKTKFFLDYATDEGIIKTADRDEMINELNRLHEAQDYTFSDPMKQFEHEITTGTIALETRDTLRSTAKALLDGICFENDASKFFLVIDCAIRDCLMITTPVGEPPSQEEASTIDPAFIDDRTKLLMKWRKLCGEAVPKNIDEFYDQDLKAYNNELSRLYVDHHLCFKGDYPEELYRFAGIRPGDKQAMKEFLMQPESKYFELPE